MAMTATQAVILKQIEATSRLTITLALETMVNLGAITHEWREENFLALERLVVAQVRRTMKED